MQKFREGVLHGLGAMRSYKRDAVPILSEHAEYSQLAQTYFTLFELSDI